MGRDVSSRSPDREHSVEDLDVSLTRGTLDLLILKSLAWGPKHGYGVVEWIESATGETLSIGEGTLYPALHRLENAHFVEGEWRLSENNRNAKFYRLSPSGRRRLKTGAASWHAFVEAAGRALRAAVPENA